MCKYGAKNHKHIHTYAMQSNTNCTYYRPALIIHINEFIVIIQYNIHTKRANVSQKRKRNLLEYNHVRSYEQIEWNQQQQINMMKYSAFMKSVVCTV